MARPIKVHELFSYARGPAGYTPIAPQNIDRAFRLLKQGYLTKVKGGPFYRSDKPHMSDAIEPREERGFNFEEHRRRWQDF